MRDLLVIVPSRERPDQLRAMITASLGLSAAETDIAVAVDDDDPKAAGYEALMLETSDRVQWVLGDRRTLAGWTNAVAAASTTGYRALASLGDDHHPRTSGWDAALLTAIDDMGTGIAYGDDLIHGEGLATAPVISSSIVDALGWMCLPACGHYCIDNAWTDLGRGAGCLAYRPGVIIEHLHPCAGKAQWDATYAAAGGWHDGHPDGAAYRAWRENGMAADIATVRTLAR